MQRTAKVVRHRVRPLLKSAELLPLVGRGAVAAPPDFVGVGAQRAGTSWWHGLIEVHPAVHPLGLSAKELHFFDERWRDDLTASDIRRYHRLFARPQGAVSGEWTPRYMHDPWTPPLLRQAAPEAKILVLLRDPVARFRSGLAHASERGMRVTPDLVTDTAARGLYWQQLTRLLHYFPREQVLVLQLERCRREPTTELAATHRFLGLSPSPPPDDLLAPVNASQHRATSHGWLADELTRQYQPDLQRLARDFPEIDLTLWPSAAR